MFQGLRLAALLAGLSLPAAAIVVPIGPVSDFEAYGDLFFNGVGRLTITKTTGGYPPGTTCSPRRTASRTPPAS